jgi:hypothetical protein
LYLQIAVVTSNLSGRFGSVPETLSWGPWGGIFVLKPFPINQEATLKECWVKVTGNCSHRELRPFATIQTGFSQEDSKKKIEEEPEVFILETAVCRESESFGMMEEDIEKISFPERSFAERERGGESCC